MKAFLYVRVSTKRQEDGTSPEAQERIMREYCAQEGFEVVDVIKDADWSGGWTIRPGLDELRERVKAGEASVIVVSVRDRFARGVYAQVLKEEFEGLGAKLVALDSLGAAETPEGELFDGIRDVFSGYEKRRIVQRMLGGKLEKAKSGKILPTRRASFGFVYNETRDGYTVDEDQMALVRRIFRMIGREGESLFSVKRAFERENIPSPEGNSHWDPSFIKKVVTDDVYFPHTHAEIASLVSPEVAQALDEGGSYGVFWFNRYRTTTRAERISLPGGGTEVRKTRTKQENDRKEWIAVPVSLEGTGIERQLVELAREAVKGNTRTTPKGPRVYELSGLFRCAECGRAMQTYTRWDKSVSKHYFYYRCQSRARYGTGACTLSRALRAQETDEKVWGAITDLLTRPELLEAGFERLLEKEKASGSEEELARWGRMIEACDTQEERLLDLYLEGQLEKSLYHTRAKRIGDRRAVALEELRRAQEKDKRLRWMEEGRDAVLREYSNLTPELLERLKPESRMRIYRIMRLEVSVDADHTLRLGGMLVAGLAGEEFTTLQGVTEITPYKVVMELGVRLSVEVA